MRFVPDQISPFVDDLCTKPFIIVHLASGIEIQAHSLQIEPTYSNVAFDWTTPPHDELNASLLEIKAKEYQAKWDNLPAFVVPSKSICLEKPAQRAGDPPDACEHLPLIEMAAVFSSDEVVDSWFQQSTLILIWHQSSLEPFMAPEVRSLVEQLDWPSVAQDVCPHEPPDEW